MNNYIIVDNDNMTFEAFNCKDEKEAVRKYFNYLVINSNKLITYFKIFDSDILTLKELLNIFYLLFSDDINIGSEISKIYVVDLVGVENYERNSFAN